MSIASGAQSRLQIGAQSDFSTAVTPTVQIEFTKESYKLLPNYISPDSLIGKTTDDRMDITGLKVEGDHEQIINPDNIGLLLSAVMGAEADPSAVSGSAVYDHVFTPISAVVGSSLPKLTVVVDRIVDVFGYYGVKIDKMSLKAQKGDYLRGTFTGRGYDEDRSSALAALTASTKRPFMFLDGTITVDAANYSDIEDATLDYMNNIENDLQTLGTGTHMQEIEPQKRDIQLTLNALFSSATNTTRTNKFAAGAKAAVILTFTSTETAATGLYYTLTVSLPNCYITAADPMVAGPDRIKVSMTLKAVESGGSPPATITLRDARSTAYIS